MTEQFSFCALFLSLCISVHVPPTLVGFLSLSTLVWVGRMHNLIFSFGVHSETRPSVWEEGRQLKKNFFLVPFLGCSRKKGDFWGFGNFSRGWLFNKKREGKLSKGLRFLWVMLRTSNEYRLTFVMQVFLGRSRSPRVESWHSLNEKLIHLAH